MARHHAIAGWVLKHSRSLTDDIFLRSSIWARVQLGIPLPAEG